MGLNNIEITEFIVGEWYKDNLVAQPVGRRTATDLQKSAINTQSVPPSTPRSAPNSNYGEFAAIAPISPNTTIPPSAAAPSKPIEPILSTPSSTPRTTSNSNYGEFAAIAPSSPNTTIPPSAATPSKPIEPTSSIPPSKPIEPTSYTPPSLKYLGNNRRNITLLINSPDTAFLADNQLAFLTRILEACHMTVADVAIVNHATAPVTITAIKQQLKPVYILLFGLEPTAIRLPINFPQFKLQPYDNCTYLSVPALDLIDQPSDQSKLLKSKLWICLQSLFNV